VNRSAEGGTIALPIAIRPIESDISGTLAAGYYRHNDACRGCAGPRTGGGSPASTARRGRRTHVQRPDVSWAVMADPDGSGQIS
jgi:hypothetical protein